MREDVRVSLTNILQRNSVRVGPEEEQAIDGFVEAFLAVLSDFREVDDEEGVVEAVGESAGASECGLGCVSSSRSRRANSYHTVFFLVTNHFYIFDKYSLHCSAFYSNSLRRNHQSLSIFQMIHH